MRPKSTHNDNERQINANPKSKSSTGAKAMRPSPRNGGVPWSGDVDPMMASPSYLTMPKPVNMPLVISWKNTMIA